MQDTLYPVIEVGEIRDKVSLHRYVNQYESLHKAVSNAYITGEMETKDGQIVHCYNYLVCDCKGYKFTVAIPDGYATLRVPEHGEVVVTLDANEYEN